MFVLLKPAGTSAQAFPRALEFLPERWLRGEGDRIHSYASLPFGIGTRMCIGKRFAEMEIYTLLARVRCTGPFVLESYYICSYFCVLIHFVIEMLFAFVL